MSGGGHRCWRDWSIFGLVRCRVAHTTAGKSGAIRRGGLPVQERVAVGSGQPVFSGQTMRKTFATERLQKSSMDTTPLVHLQVPPGMDAVLRGLTREVLRRQPSDLYLFAHKYFESLLDARVAQQAGDEVTDAESLYSKKQSKHSESSYSMRDYFRDDEPKKKKKKEGSREFVHRIHLEDDSCNKNVVHNINIEVEGGDTSLEETTVKVEITEDEEKKKTESRDTTSFEEAVTTTRTEHVTVCKSWKVETRVETSESGEIRVESFTDAGKPRGKARQSSKPRKFVSEEEKKSKVLIEEEKRAAKAEKEKKNRESSKSLDSADKSASRELIVLEKQAAAQKAKADDGWKYKSFIRLDDEEIVKSPSERFIEIEREGDAHIRSRRDVVAQEDDNNRGEEREDDEALTRSRGNIGDSTREASPVATQLTQSPQVSLQKMEESLIKLKELEAKDESLKTDEIISQKRDLSEPVAVSISPEQALIQMEKSLKELKETSLVNEETRTKTHVSDLSKGELISDEKQSHMIKSKEEPKSSHISDEKNKIIEHVKEVVHTIEEKASSVFSHIHHQSSEEQSMTRKSEDDSSISERKHRVMEDVKEVVHEIEEKTSSVLSHFPEKIKTSVEDTEGIDPTPDDKESIVVEALVEENKPEKSPETDKIESSAQKIEGDPCSGNMETIVGEAQGKEDTQKKNTEPEKIESFVKTEGWSDNKESIVVETRVEEETQMKIFEPEKIQSAAEKTGRDPSPKNTESVAEARVEEETHMKSPESERIESSAEQTEGDPSQNNTESVSEARVEEETHKKSPESEKIQSSAEKTEGDPSPNNTESVAEARVEEETHKRSPETEKIESSAEETEGDLAKVGVEEETRKKSPVPEKIESSVEKTEGDLAGVGKEEDLTKSSAGKTESDPRPDDTGSITVEDQVEEETQKKSPELERRDASPDKTERYPRLDDTESITVEAQVQGLQSDSPKPREIQSSESEEVTKLKGKGSVVEVDTKIETQKKSPEPMNIESLTERTDVLDTKSDGKEKVVNTQVAEETRENSYESDKKESITQKTGEDPEPEGKEIINEEAKTGDRAPQSTTEPEKVKPLLKIDTGKTDDDKGNIMEAEVKQESQKMIIESEKAKDLTEKFDKLDIKGNVVEEAETEEEKRDEITGNKTPEHVPKAMDKSNDTREDTNEDESKGRHKREVEGTASETEEKSVEVKKDDSEAGVSKEELSKQTLDGKSPKEESLTTQQLLKDEKEITQIEQKKDAPTEGTVKEAQGVKSPNKSLEKEEDDIIADTLLKTEVSLQESVEEQMEAEQIEKTEIIKKDSVEISPEKKGEEENSQTTDSDSKETKEAKDGLKEEKGGPNVSENLLKSVEQLKTDDTETKAPMVVGKTLEDESADEPTEAREAALEKSTSGEETAESKETGEIAAREPAVKPEVEFRISKLEKEATEDKADGDSKDHEKAPGEQHPEQTQVAQEIRRVRRSTEETITKTEEVSESVSTSVMTKTIHLKGAEMKNVQKEVTEHQKQTSETTKEEFKTELVDIEDVFGQKMYPDSSFGTVEKEGQKATTNSKGGTGIGDSTIAPHVESPTEDKKSIDEEGTEVDSSQVDIEEDEKLEEEEIHVESSSKDNIEEGKTSEETHDAISIQRESSKDKPHQRKLASLEEESSSVSEGTGDGFLPPTVVISRVADVAELTDGEDKIVSQMEKEGLTTEYDENTKVKTGYWSADEANKFLAGESQHTYFSLRKHEILDSHLHEARPPEKTVQNKLVEVEEPPIEYVVEEHEEMSPDNIQSLGRDSDSTGSPVKFSLVEVDDTGEEVKHKDKPWLARAHTVDEIFEKETVGDVMPVAPTPPRRSSVPGQVNVMMEMSKATSLVGQSIMVLSGGEKQPVRRSDSDEYCISKDAIYIPLRAPEEKPDVVEESDEEPFRIDQPPPIFTYDSDEGEWGGALAEHIKKQPPLTTIIIERKDDDPSASALGRVTITEITDEEEKALQKEHATERRAVEDLPKPVFEIGSPVSDRSADLGERIDAKHRPSLADISEENLESAEDNEGSMNVELHISLSDGDNLSQRSYGTDSERKWTEDLSSVANKAKDAATGMIKNLFGSSPRRDRQSPAGSESSLILEADTDGRKRTRKKSESKEESDRVREPLGRSSVVEEETSNLVRIPKNVETRSSTSSKHEDDMGKTVEVQQENLEKSRQETKAEKPMKNENRATKRSLEESSETSQSLTSVSLPLPDASYDIKDATSSTSADIDTSDVKDSSDVFEDDVPSETSKPETDHTHQKGASSRSKRNAGDEQVQEDTLKGEVGKKVSEGSGAAAGTAIQNEAKEERDEKEKEDTQVSAKYQGETDLTGQEATSEPKDSVTSIISETLDSVESLPSEVSKNLWSIEDEPSAENIHSNVQTEKTDEPDASKKNSQIKEGGTADKMLESIEHQVETTEQVVDNIRDKSENKIKSEEEKVKRLVHTAKEDMRHRLERGVEVVEDSLEDAENEWMKVETEVEKDLKEHTQAIRTAKDDIAEKVQDGAGKMERDAKEAAEKISEVIEEKAHEDGLRVQKAMEREKTELDNKLDNVEKAISGIQHKMGPVFEEDQRRVKLMGGKAIKAMDEISVEVSENVKDAEETLEKNEEELKSGFNTCIEAMKDAAGDVIEKVSDVKTHVEDKLKSVVHHREKQIEEEITETEEQSEKLKSGIQAKIETAETRKSKVDKVIDAAAHEVTDKVQEISEDTLKTIKGEIIEKVKEAEEITYTPEEKTKETENQMREVAGRISAEEFTDTFSEKELAEVEKRLEDSIERDDGVDTVDGRKVVKSTMEDQESETKDGGEIKGGEAAGSSTTKMVLDKRKSEDDKVQREETEISELLTRTLISSSRDDTKTDSSETEDSSETRGPKRHVLKRGVTVGDVTQSKDTIPSESVDDVSMASVDKQDTVVHVTLDEPDAGGETTRTDEVIVPIHVELEQATPVPPGKDTKATETDLLDKETVSRGTEPEETTEQIAEALRSEVKDLEERLSRLKESTWSLSHAGPDSKKGQRDVRASRNTDEGEDVTEKTVHVKKSISSAESMSFASRVLSTPMGSVKEEYSEMKKSTAETTLETVLTVEKGVQYEEGERGSDRKEDSGPERRTTVTTATQVSVPSEEPSDDESRRALFQRAKSMDAKTEARAITNFSKRNSKKAVEQKADSSRTQQKREFAKK